MARMEEAKGREELMRQLHRLESQITNVVYRIRRFVIAYHLTSL